MFTHETRTWLIDMDGVIVREEEPIEGSAEFLARLRRLGTRSWSSPTTRSTPRETLRLG